VQSEREYTERGLAARGRDVQDVVLGIDHWSERSWRNEQSIRSPTLSPDNVGIVVVIVA
jgi:hypothetical protein